MAEKDLLAIVRWFSRVKKRQTFYRFLRDYDPNWGKFDMRNAEWGSLIQRCLAVFAARLEAKRG